MVNSIYILAPESQSGKSMIALGLMQALMKNRSSVAFFRPVIDQSPNNKLTDPDITLIKEHFNLDIPYEDTYACTLSEARRLVSSGQETQLYDTILKKFKALQEKYGFVLCEGSDIMGRDNSFEINLNAKIALNLGSPIVLVSNAQNKSCQDIIESTQSSIDYINDFGVDVLACLVNKANWSSEDMSSIKAALVNKKSKSKNTLLTYVLPEDQSLGSPSIGDIKEQLNASVLYGEDQMQVLVSNYLIAAMQVGNFMDYIQKGSLVITPGDRSDIILACLASRNSFAYPDIAGILLTGGIDMPESIHKLIGGLPNVGVPILVASEHTAQAIKTLSYMHGKIVAKDTQKIEASISYFDKYVNAKDIIEQLGAASSSIVTPMMFEYGLSERASKNKMRIVLPEAMDERILMASQQLIKNNIVDIIFVGEEKAIRARMLELSLDFPVTIIEPEKFHRFNEYVETYKKMREKKGITLEQARDTMTDVTYFATMMVQTGEADGMVSGAVHTTAHTIRPAFEIIKTKPDVSIVSSVFFMCMKDGVLVFGDCAVNPNPKPEELADIAINSAHTASIFGIEPKVAMLSYSTGSSGKGADVDIVKEATEIAKAKAPDLLLEGPLQYDAAIDPTVANLKMPNSKVAGQATVFIFPDLNTGNNTYKAVQRAAKAIAIGPVLQGLNKPVNDLSRGCSVPDIINTVAITAIQAQSMNKTSI